MTVRPFFRGRPAALLGRLFLFSVIALIPAYPAAAQFGGDAFSAGDAGGQTTWSGEYFVELPAPMPKKLQDKTAVLSKQALVPRTNDDAFAGPEPWTDSDPSGDDAFGDGDARVLPGSGPYGGGSRLEFCHVPVLQGATCGTIGPQAGDATVVQGVNTAGTVRRRPASAISWPRSGAHGDGPVRIVFWRPEPG